MKLIFLGTGGLNTFGKRNPAGILLEADKKRILLDCGTGTMSKMVDKNINYLAIDGAFISHCHLDHCSELAPLTASMSITGFTFPKQLRKKEFIIRGPKEVKKIYKFIRSLLPVKDNFPINIRAFNDEERFGNLILKTMLVDHLPGTKKQSFAMRIEVGGKSIVYSGDMDWGEKISDFIEFSKDCDAMVIDGGKAIGVKFSVHLEPFQISQIAYQANPKKLVVTHLTDINTPAEISDAISEFYKGEVLITRDGMELTL